MRRSLLGNADEAGNYRFSLTVQLAQIFLAEDGIVLENGVRDPETMRFGRAEIPRFYPNVGGYVRTDNGGNQALINFRAGDTPFEQVSYLDVVEGTVPLALLQDRALLIGYAAESVKDYESSSAIANANPSAIPGIAIQAHALSQILSAVYDGRPFIRTLPNLVEYLLILASGALGVAIAHWQKKPGIHLAIVIGISASWILLAYLILVVAWWLPMVPTLTVFLLNAIALYPFYQAQTLLQAQIKEQEKLIEQTYTTIHNGPLQVIAQMLKSWPDSAENNAQSDDSKAQLEQVNRELRGIREILQEEMRSPSEKLVMMGEQSVDLQMPLHIVLSETYSNTIDRYQSFFQPLIKIRSFEPMADGELTGREKRAIGRFLEEALTNIYKYAEKTTRVTVSCKRTDTHNIVQILDDGQSKQSAQPIDHEKYGHEGYGTKQAGRIARQLGGKFERKSIEPQGTCCELRWPIQLSAWQRWMR
ncbi:MAG: CHASE2 domain-containing protein [Cyanobacteria bacterium J06649_4]